MIDDVPLLYTNQADCNYNGVWGKMSRCAAFAFFLLGGVAYTFT